MSLNPPELRAHHPFALANFPQTALVTWKPGRGRCDDPTSPSGTVLPRKETMTLRVLVVDDHPAFRRALTSALRLVRDIEVVGEAGGGIAACEDAETTQPDLVLMDLSMPDLSGIDAMRQIHKKQPDLPVVILTAHADPGVEKEARESGAAGFLAKGVGLERLVTALREAAAGARNLQQRVG